MAIDTTEKKLSLLNFGLPFWRTLPESDGTIDQDDKQHLLGLYSGITVVTAAVTVPQTQLPRVAVSSSQIPRASYGVFDINQHIHREIDARLDGVDLELFNPSYSNGGANTWDASCWIGDIDLTGLSPYNSSNPIYGGTLVSPQDVLFVYDNDAHSAYTPAVGTTILFVDVDGNEVSRTVADREIPLQSNFGVCRLNVDLPSGVRFYKILPPDFGDYITLNGLPVVICDQEQKAFVGVITDSAFGGSQIEIQAGSSPRDVYWENIVVGDSGHPTFLLIGSELVLLGLHYGAADGFTTLYDKSVRRWLYEINITMSNLGSGYQLTPFDFEAFIARMRRESVAASGIGRVAVGSSTLIRV